MVGSGRAAASHTCAASAAREGEETCATRAVHGDSTVRAAWVVHWVRPRRGYGGESEGHGRSWKAMEGALCVGSVADGGESEGERVLGRGSVDQREEEGGDGGPLLGEGAVHLCMQL